MTAETKRNGADGTADDSTQASSAAEQAANDIDEAVTEPAPSDDERMAQLEAENADLKDRYLRLAAEMENLRRRTTRDVKDARSYSIAGFARDMLAVSDNLRRAIDAVPQEMLAGDDAGLKALIEGVEMTERSMQSALERHGVRKIEPEGQKFDPNFHQAMFEIDNAEVPAGTVQQVVQTGYVIGDRVLRPAMVGVTKGGPKPAERHADPQQPGETATSTTHSPAGDAEPGPPDAEAERDA